MPIDTLHSENSVTASRSLLSAGIGLAVALVYGYFAWTGINSSPLDDLITSSGFPKILAGLLLVLGVIELSSGFRKRIAVPRENRLRLFEPVLDRALWEGPLLVLGTGFLYVIIVPIIGYPLGIILVAAATAVAAGARQYLSVLGVSACISVAYFILFQFVMGTGQPLGFLDGIF